ncbi:MAG: InlB B-repeat-containing protein, partial [Clostridia bacterium]|nr:InlB B-repeat-containing protein [Clostridia bacterium]
MPVFLKNSVVISTCAPLLFYLFLYVFSRYIPPEKFTRIVNVNDGGKINVLKTGFESSSGKLLGDYVIYLNDGTIEKIESFNGGTFSGKKVIVVNEDNADTPTSGISNISNIVKYTGNGTVVYDTAKNKLVLTRGEGINFIKVNDAPITLTAGVDKYEAALSAITTIKFLEEDDGSETPAEYTVTYVNEKGEAPEAAKGYADTLFTVSAVVPELEGYMFSGWSDGNNTYSPKDTFILVKDVTLTAVWEKLPDEAVHISAYRKAGYSIVYVSDKVTEDGTGATLASPRKFTEMHEVLNAVVTENCKVVIAIDGQISSSWSVPNAVNGADVILT